MTREEVMRKLLCCLQNEVTMVESSQIEKIERVADLLLEISEADDVLNVDKLKITLGKQSIILMEATAPINAVEADSAALKHLWEELEKLDSTSLKTLARLDPTIPVA